MKYQLFMPTIEDMKRDPERASNIFIGPDVFTRISSKEAKVILPLTLVTYDEQFKLARAIADYLNMCEDAKNEIVKDKTVATAVLQRLHRES